jgi:hypothetical protein
VWADLHIIADNVATETFAWLEQVASEAKKASAAVEEGACSSRPHFKLTRTYYGHGSGSFNHALDLALKLPEGHVVYFLEDDYLHLPGSLAAVREGLSVADYVTLYDHPDKYVDSTFTSSKGVPGSVDIQDGGELSRVLQTASAHWKTTSSTTMTFASTVATLRTDERALRHFSKWDQEGQVGGEGTYTFDYGLFSTLVKKLKRTLISPIPTYSTHGETRVLAGLVDWAGIARAGVFLDSGLFQPVDHLMGDVSHVASGGI